jgi:hypothetical protein
MLKWYSHTFIINMAWNFRRRIKIIPGVHLNFSKNGVSTSIGVRGASVTFGSKGTYFNAGIPGTGLYSRQKISSSSASLPNLERSPEVMTQVPGDNIFSEDVLEITSQDMAGIKQAIVAAREQRTLLRSDLSKVKLSLLFSHIVHVLTYVVIVGIFIKKLTSEIRTDIASKRNAILQLTQQIQNAYVKIEVDFDPEIKTKFDNVVTAFRKLATSQKIWDVTGSYYNDRKATRSAASTGIKRTEVNFGIRELEDVRSQFETLWMKNANGADMYCYPNFVVMFSNRQKFAVVSLSDLQLEHSAMGFLEGGSVPRDSKVIEMTWAKVNKNGSPDKRFKDNYQIPIVKYGEIRLRTGTGVNEEYQFSNYEFSREFADAFNAYQKVISTVGQRSNTL